MILKKIKDSNMVGILDNKYKTTKKEEIIIVINRNQFNHYIPKINCKYNKTTIKYQIIFPLKDIQILDNNINRRIIIYLSNMDIYNLPMIKYLCMLKIQVYIWLIILSLIVKFNCMMEQLMLVEYQYLGNICLSLNR